MKITLNTTTSIPDPERPGHGIQHYADEVIDVTNEIGERLVRLGAAEKGAQKRGAPDDDEA